MRSFFAILLFFFVFVIERVHFICKLLYVNFVLRVLDNLLWFYT